LLVVAASLPCPPDPATLEHAWTRIARAQYDSGALPQQAPEGEGGADPEPDFLHCYHSTLMAAFAAAQTVKCLSGEADDDGAAPHAESVRNRYGGQGVPG
jgi:hypothetical protein